MRDILNRRNEHPVLIWVNLTAFNDRFRGKSQCSAAAHTEKEQFNANCFRELCKSVALLNPPAQVRRRDLILEKFWLAEHLGFWVGRARVIVMNETPLNAEPRLP